MNPGAGLSEESLIFSSHTESVQPETAPTEAGAVEEVLV